MTDRPILFSAPMVRAMLAGTKTQTRRTLNPQPFPVGGPFYRPSPSTKPNEWHSVSASGHIANIQTIRIAYGDRLWVKETWRPLPIDLAPWDIEVAYAADGERRIIKDGEFGDNDWTMPKAAKHGNVSPLFMPRWASRLTLTVTDVRVERLQDISKADAIAEGIERRAGGYSVIDEKRGMSGISESARVAYSMLWDVINGPGAWEANPWVAAYTFTVHRGNIDLIGGAA